MFLKCIIFFIITWNHIETSEATNDTEDIILELIENIFVDVKAREVTRLKAEHVSNESKGEKRLIYANLSPNLRTSVEGLLIDSIQCYYGIPYAQPPTGERR